MSNTITLCNNYACLVRATSQLHTTTSPSNTPSFNPNKQWQGQIATIQTGINRLGFQLSALKDNLGLSSAEAAQRRLLLEELRG
jgi:hypothetical protein